MRTRKLPLVKEQPPLPLTIIGAGRAAREAIPALAEINSHTRLKALYLDASHGQSLALVDAAKQQGITAMAHEARIEDALGDLPPELLQQVLVNLDHGSPVADFLERALTAKHVLIYQVVKPVQGPLYGLRAYLAPHDQKSRADQTTLFRTFGELTIRRGGSRAIVGDEGAYEDRMGEPLLRAWMAEHTRDVLRKTVANLPPEVAPLEVTDDFGATTMPAFIHHGQSWTAPDALARSIVEHPPQPMLRGEPFMVIELVSSVGIRWHKAQLRFDGRIRMERTLREDLPPPVEVVLRDDEVVANATTALSRAERNEVVPTNPMFTTD